jgi:hypothetical protein
MEKKNELIFKSGEISPTLENKRYKLTQIKLVKGTGIEGFRLNIISFIGEVRSNIPITFSSLPDIEYLNEDRKAATIAIKLDFRDKRDVEFILTSPINESEYEFVIEYDIL